MKQKRGNRSPRGGSMKRVTHPATGALTPTGSEMASKRVQHTAATLADGRVPIAGGRDENETLLASTELYNPRTGSFVEATPMTRDRAYHRATLLGSGEVPISGGEFLTGGTAWQLETAEIFTP
jgi:hypothetical protein